MNRIFRVLWNAATGTFVVTSETAKSRGKKSGRRKLAVSALISLSSIMVSADALANAGNDTGKGIGTENGWIAIGEGAEADSTITTKEKVAEDPSKGYVAGAGIAIGYYSKASGASSTALGGYSLAESIGSVALGAGAHTTSTAKYSMAVGTNAVASNLYAIALGTNANASGKNSIALGRDTVSSAERSLTVGLGANAASLDSMAFGYNTSVTSDAANGIAFGSGAVTSAKNSVAIGSNSTATEENVVSVGSDALKRKIVNVGNGAISESSTDAVNGSQLFATNANVTQNTTDIAANTDSINQNTTDIATNTTNINSLSDSVTTLTDDALLWDAASGAFSAKHNGSDSKLTNLAAGTLAADSTDAVNGSQLFDTNEKVDKNTADIATNTDSINQNTADITANTDSINQNTTDIAANTTSINQNTTDIATNTTNINNLSDSITGLTDDALLWDAASGAFSAKHNGSDSKITNLAAGTLAADSTDAVNGSQLFATNENVSQNTTDIAANTTNINSLSDSVTTLTDDALLWDAASGAFSAKHNGSDSKITNLAAGTLAADSTDAVNGSQLFATNENVSQNTTDIAANTTSITQNTTDIATNTTSINSLSDSVTTLTDDALLWDATSGAFSANRNGSASKIINVAAGDLSEDSTDAVNGSQLYETNQKVDQNTSAIADINTSITNLSSDNLSWNETTSSFSASHGSSTTNKITNVAAGELSEESTDAVNGSQLFETNEKVDQNTTDIAANTTNITQNSTAIENLNTSVSDINTSITGLTDNALLWDEDIGAFSANHGGSTSKITNVAAGALSEDSTDAVNGSQLYETNQKVDQNTSAIADINTSITNLGTDALSWDDEGGAFSASHGTSGTNKITNVAAGEIASDSTDAVNGSQLYETNMLISQYNESISQLAGDTSETYITENGTGVKYIRTNDNGLEGQDAYATGNGATAVGYDAVASGAGSLALGQNSSSSIDGSIALGSGSTSNRAISSGIQTTSVTSDGVVIGYNTTDRKLLGALSLGTDGESYRQITNVADGSEAQDAVTVRQLQNAIGAVTTTPTKYYHANSTEEDSLAVGTDSLAMGAKTIVNADAGIGIGLNTLVMADAINGIAIGSNARANHANSIAMGNGSQTTRGAQTDYTAYNMDTPQNSVGEFSVGSEDGQRQITNVAAGSADTDAVNVSQLKVTDAQVSRNTQSITNLNTQVSNLDTRVTNIENGIGDIVTTGSTKYFKTNTDGADANAQGADSVAIGSGSIAAAENSVA
ncbi:ESPR-type extended signal peptide-containing protein, partial [Salmonella enterica]|uniref:ESPR-type extended signal peptide-containing protein n=1 Tax=Salmonella enterica TaxID=28901 RepID=UPI00344DCC8A